jgi:predicted phage terminase large subunit-like protein
MQIANLDDKLNDLSEDKLKQLYVKCKALEKINSEESYHYFFKRAWKVLEPETPLVDTWHIKYLCDILQGEVERIVAGKPKDKDLIINIAPRSGKSYIVNVMLAPWVWTKHPSMKIINSSFSMDLSTKLCLDSRRLIESDWYQALWGHVYKLTTDMNTKSWYENNKRGMRKSTSTGAQITGTGGDIIIVDDPADPQKAESDVDRETVKRYYGGTLYSRLNNQIVGLRLIIMQRLHEDDLTGHLMHSDPDHYKHICIPAELTPDVCPKELAENYVDGLFCPERFSRDVLEQSKLPANLGAYGYSGQMLQRPSPAEGGMFKRYWWRFWKKPGQEVGELFYKDEKGIPIKAVICELPKTFDQIVDSWDTALEGKETSDDVAGGKWAKVGATKYLLDQTKGKLDFPETKKAVKALRESNPNTSSILIEKSSNGPAVEADLRKEVPGIILIHTGKLSKEDRVKISDTVPYTAQCEAGNIYLPHPEIAPWVDGFIDEHANFPKTAQDGQVDQSSQAVNYLTTKKNVWPYYQPTDPAHHRAFDLKWEYTINIGGIFLSKDMKLSFLCALWSRTKKKLFIYGELISDSMSLPQVAMKLFKGMKMEYRKNKGIMGNADMFKDDTKSTALLLNREIQSLEKAKGKKKTLHVKEPYMYNRLGSINLVNLMFHRGDIIVHESAEECSRQFSSWYIDKDKPVPTEFELCETLCQIVSELNRTEKLNIPVPQPRDYPAIHAEDEEKEKKSRWYR